MPVQRAAPPLVLAVVVASLQTAAGVLLVGLGLAAAVSSSAAGHAARASGTPDGWSGFGVLIASGLVLAGAVTTVVIGIPLLVLRGRSATRRTTGRGLLIGAEALLLLPPLIVVASRVAGTGLGDPVAAAAGALALAPLVAVGALLAPSTRRWATAPAEQA